MNIFIKYRIQLVVIILVVLAASPTHADLKARWMFDEGAGAVAADATGNGYNGALSNVGWVDGQLGDAVSFDGGGAISVITITDPTDAISPGNLSGGVGG